MRISMVAAGTVLAAVSSVPAVANASYEIDGVYTAISNGDWAQTNARFEDRPTVISTWTIDTTCRSPYDCEGTVTSDQGWQARIFTRNGPWRVDRDLPEWLPCRDGPPGRGRQIFQFSPIGADGRIDFGSTTFAGTDKTTGDTGACGVSRWVTIEMPFKLVKVT